MKGATGFVFLVLVLAVIGQAQPARTQPMPLSGEEFSIFIGAVVAPDAPHERSADSKPLPGETPEGEPSVLGEAESESEVALPHEGPAPRLLNLIVHHAGPMACTPRYGEVPGVHRPPAQQ